MRVSSAIVVLVGVLGSALVLACQSSGGSSSGGENGDGSAQGADDASGASDASASGDGPHDGAAPDAGLPPVDPSLKLTALSASQLGVLCDWLANILGGYGTPVACGGGINNPIPANQAECVAEYTYRTGCLLTVSQFETCTIAQAPSHGCNLPDPQCTAEGYCISVPAGD